MVNHIVNEEACHGDKVSSLVSVYAYLAKGKQQGKSSRVCWRCGKPGHIKNFCTEEEVPEQGKSGNGSSVGGQANLVLGGGGNVSDLVDLDAREIWLRSLGCRCRHSRGSDAIWALATPATPVVAIQYVMIDAVRTRIRLLRR